MNLVRVENKLYAVAEFMRILKIEKLDKDATCTLRKWRRKSDRDRWIKIKAQIKSKSYVLESDC